MMKKTEVLVYYFGSNDIDLIISYFAFGIIGVVICVMIDVMMRDKKSTPSPEEFQWKWFFRDNTTRIFLNIILMLVSVRFTP